MKAVKIFSTTNSYTQRAHQTSVVPYPVGALTATADILCAEILLSSVGGARSLPCLSEVGHLGRAEVLIQGLTAEPKGIHCPRQRKAG